jgi:hypothetical protein
VGLETIRDEALRKNWDSFIQKAHKKLQENGINNVTFTTFKYDGAYAKAKTGLPSSYWAFAQDSSRTWVELELKSRVSKGERYSQTDLYECIKEDYRAFDKKVTNITWDEEDRSRGHRKYNGLDVRIKIYCKGSVRRDISSAWISTMVEFIKTFNPIIQSCK